eukprot:g19029.t1
MATATLQAESARESQARLSELQRQLERQIREHREHLSKVAQDSCVIEELADRDDVFDRGRPVKMSQQQNTSLH